MNRTHIVDNLNQYEEIKPNIGDNIDQIGRVEGNEKISEVETISTPPGMLSPLPKAKTKNYHCFSAIHPEPFSDGDPKPWLRQYELIAKGNGWDDEMKASKLLCYLIGASRIWYVEHVNPDVQISWGDLKEGLIKKFTNKCNTFTAPRKIKGREQKEDESFEKYWFEKEQLINSLCPQKSEEDKMNDLIEGMRNPLKRRVRSHVMVFPCRNLAELYDLAKSFNDEDDECEQEEADTGSRRDKAKKSQKGDEGLRSDLANLTKTVNDLKSVLLNTEKSKNRNESYNPRGNRGGYDSIHIQRDYVSKGNGKTSGQNNRADIRCYACDGSGHISRYCPNKKDSKKNLNSKKQD